ncbi:MAG TPA: hypothetical protein VND19_21890 [Acetobacteraceae bacterium]|nr:hypothetical protein [Acetobacteraceae bacterium]
MTAKPVALLLSLAVAGLLGGCTRPAVALKPPAFQQSADALRDWQAVAQQIALDMMYDGLLPDPASPNPAAASGWRTPFYVKIVTPRSQFLYEVAQSLEAEILRHGGAVVQSPVGAAEIDLDVDVVQWPPRDRLPDGTFTAAGFASGGAVVMANEAPLTPAAGFGVLAGAGILADLLRTMTPDTNTEIAWGASIAEGNRIVFAVRYPMYIADADVSLYTGSVPPAGPPLVQLRYVP